MKIPNKLLTAFRKMQTDGDGKEAHQISIELGKKRSQICIIRALRDGICDETTLEVLCEFYKRKKKKFDRFDKLTKHLDNE